MKKDPMQMPDSWGEHIKSLTVTSDPANPKEGDSQVKLVATTAQGTGDVTWLLNGKPLPNDSRYEISGTSLVIKNVTCQDTGLYTCILKNPFSNDTFNKNITIFYGPENPQIVVTVGQSVSTENFVKVGDWLSLTCQAVGDPAPSYFWSSESQKNITGSQSGVLSLKNIQTNQSGVYTCVMTNPVTSVSIEKNYTVNVYASPSGDPICSVKAVQSNTALEYQCSWMGGTPLALLQFTLPNATQGGGYLNHTEVASPSLNGQIVTCIGTHPIVSKNCSIVAGSPDGIFPLLTTTMDSSGALVVTISCASTFLPQPTVQWSKNNQVLNNGGNFAISGDTSQLTISNFNINGGNLTTYTCNNVNPLGAKSNSMTLRGPTIGDSSLFPNKQGTIVTLTWETPRDSVITGFDIQMKGPDLRRSKRSTNEFTTLQMTGASNHSLDIFGLHPKSTYRFRIIPLAGQTQGAPSQEHRIGPGEGLNGAAIAGIAAGIPCSIFLLLFVLVLIILCVVCAVKRKRREQSYPVTKTNGTVVETDPEKSKTKTGVTGQLKDEEKPFSLPSCYTLGKIMDSRRHLLFFSLLQGIAICVICQQWGVTVPSMMSAVEGSCLVIPCTYTYSPSSPPHKFEAVWYQYVSRGYPLVYSKTGDIIAKFQGRTELVGDVEKGNCSLKISNMTIHDSSEKIYPWIDPDHVSYRTYTFYDSTVTIEVSGSAQAPEMTVKGALTEGESFDVYCSTVHNCPSSPPSFYFGDTRFSANHTAESDGRWRSAAVFSQKAQHGHNGKTINCTVRHPGGKTATSGITLNIAYAPRNVNISTKSQIVQAGSNISLSCTSDGNPTPDQFQWYQYNGSTSLGLNQFSRDITIRIIEKDESWFYCVARNSLGQANSSLITVIAEYKPAISLESHCFIYQGSITCWCLAKSRPVALVEWSVNGKHPHAGFNVHSTSNNHLVKGHLMGHTHTENLVVFCKATNTYGSDQLTLQVFVKERPKNVSWTQIPKKVEEGNPVTLFCQSEGYPPASSFHWYKVQNGQGVKLNGESQTFLIAKATRDQGPFYCTVYNEIGQISSAILPLNVDYAPAVLADSHCKLDGGTIRCECVVDSSPLSSITWKINGTAPPRGFNMSTTVRENLNIGVMTGKIETNDLVINCTATNRLGEKTFQLPIRGIFNWKIIYSIVGGAALLIILCIMIGCRKYLSSSVKGTSKANSKDMVISNLTPQTKQKEEDLTGTNERAYEIEYPRTLLCKNKAVEEAVYENLQATGSKTTINKEMSFTSSL